MWMFKHRAASSYCSVNIFPTLGGTWKKSCLAIRLVNVNVNAKDDICKRLHWYRFSRHPDVRDILLNQCECLAYHSHLLRGWKARHNICWLCVSRYVCYLVTQSCTFNTDRSSGFATHPFVAIIIVLQLSKQSFRWDFVSSSGQSQLSSDPIFGALWRKIYEENETTAAEAAGTSWNCRWGILFTLKTRHVAFVINNSVVISPRNFRSWHK